MAASRPSAGEERFDQVLRARGLLALALLPPLLFFFFLVLWFREGVILIPVATGLYIYMLAQFFYFRNPRFLSRRGRGHREE